MRLKMLSMEYLQKYNIEKVQHLLHLYYIGKVKGSMHHRIQEATMKIQRFALYNQVKGTNDESETLTMIPTTSQLKEHGIQFRKKEINSSSNSLDISFKNGIMKIPHVNIEDNTSSIYRNLLVVIGAIL
ncbi:hypothetical protein ZOSMA_94G00200 [Zostera marina]|uniref:Uncharacterized protein n=1 Tax=Zostera marina TaxID=29655 RepID=A0A0K9NIA2_ZOSMR|nr:hypothetical protein ZOSMA_94G00200 [Zostera marina]